MNIILEQDLFHLYFNNETTSQNKGIFRLLQSIFSNIENKFILNNTFWDCIINSLDPDDPKIDLYRQLFQKIISDSQYISIKSDNNLEYINILNSLIKNYKTNASYSESIFVILNHREYSTKLLNVGSIDRISKPNKSWLYFNLAAYSPSATTVRYFDFKNNTEISVFFSDIYNLVHSPKIVWIFDRHRNTNHTCFDPLIGSVKFHYVTINFPSAQNKYVLSCISAKYKSSLVFCVTPELLHERRILIGNLIIEMDDDFPNITYNRQTWKIDITTCKVTSKKLLDKSSKFKRIM